MRNYTKSRKAKHIRPRLSDALSNIDNKPPPKPSIWTQIQTAVAHFGNDKRRQQQQALGASNEVVAQQIAIEQQQKQDLMIAGTGFAMATVGVWLSPLLYLPSVLCVLYAFRGFYQDTYRILVEKRQIYDYRILQALMITGALLAGFTWVAALGSITALITKLLVTKTGTRSQQQVMDLFDGQMKTVWMVVNGQEIEVPFEQIKPKDIIVVQAGQMIPVDGLIKQGTATIDQHILTGESQPMEKEAGDTVFASTLVLTGRIRIVVEKAGEATIAAQIGEILTQTDDFQQLLLSRSERLANQLILPMSGLSLLSLPIAGVSGALAILWYYPGFKMLTYGPLSMLSYLQVAAQEGILIKDGRSLETLHVVDVVLFDKTGTLTLEKPTVSHIFCYTDLSEDELLRYAAAAEAKQSHPIACAILQAAETRQLALPSIDNAEYRVGYGLDVMLEGHQILVGSIRFMQMENISIPPEVLEQQEFSHMTGNSLVLVAVDDVLAGCIELQPTIRPEAASIITYLQARQIDTMIISGDHETPTKRLADALGIEHYIAQVLPEDKSDLVAQLQKSGHTVCFVGDGINDSIALKTADVAISLSGATTIATDVAQIVFMDGTLRQLDRLFQLVDEFDQNMRMNIGAATIPNVAGIACTLLFGWGMTFAPWFAEASMPIGIYNAIRPLMRKSNGKESLVSDNLNRTDTRAYLQNGG